MLLLDDDDELALVADAAEAALAAKLGDTGINAIDARILGHVRSIDQKIARIIASALESGGFSPWDDGCVELHNRRVIALIEAGQLQPRGNVRKPRWSEARLVGTPLMGRYLRGLRRVAPDARTEVLFAIHNATVRSKEQAGRLEMECPKCLEKMELGFVGDKSRNWVRAQVWYSGPLEWSTVFGVLKWWKRRRIFVQTMRCVGCGYLESFARDSTSV